MLIDNFDENWLQELDVSYQTRGEENAIHILIDGVFVPSLHKKLPQASIHMLFELLPGFNDETRDVSPFVVEYSPGDKQLRSVLEACNGWPMVSAITSPESPQTLAERLAAWCVVDADGEYLNLRFPDTRRLPDILAVLDVEQRACFTGPAKSWSYIGRTGTWIEAPLTPRHVAPSSQPRLHAEQFQKLVDASDVDTLLARATSIGCQMKSSFKSTQYSITKLVMNIAAENGLQEEMLSWCNFCLESTDQADVNSITALFADWKVREIALAQRIEEV